MALEFPRHGADLGSPRPDDTRVALASSVDGRTHVMDGKAFVTGPRIDVDCVVLHIKRSIVKPSFPTFPRFVRGTLICGN